MTEVLDKALVEICKLQEAFHFIYLSRSFLFFDSLDFVIFHLYFSSNYYF